MSLGDALLPPGDGPWLDGLRLLAREYRGGLILVYGGIVGGGLLWQRYLLRESPRPRLAIHCPAEAAPVSLS